jgi:hypothetical protein
MEVAKKRGSFSRLTGQNTKPISPGLTPLRNRFRSWNQRLKICIIQDSCHFNYFLFLKIGLVSKFADFENSPQGFPLYLLENGEPRMDLLLKRFVIECLLLKAEKKLDNAYGKEKPDKNSQNH